MKLRLARLLTRIERRLERLFITPKEAKVIAAYIGYATPEHLIARGRVLASHKAEVAVDGQSRWVNLRQILRMFLTDEVADVTVTSGDISAQTDEEGYFTLLLPRDGASDWVDVTVKTASATGICPVRAARPDAEVAVISDIDDTMMATGAWSIWRNLWISLTGNALTRHVFPDAVELMQELAGDDRNPVYFVSSSPWNFHEFLQAIFARTGLPRAPMFLRDYGISETQLITGTHGDHKGAAIDVILAAHPDLPFVLIGDTGQHDPIVYADAAERNPGRIRQVILRSAGGIGPEDAREVEHLKALGVHVHMGDDYADAIAEIKAGRITDMQA